MKTGPTEILMPWPPRQLNPNARVHWAEKSRITKQFRKDCWATALSHSVKPIQGKVKLNLTFRPSDKRKRDIDNMLSSCKAMLDGLADALKTNDHNFHISMQIGEVLRGGGVLVRVEAA